MNVLITGANGFVGKNLTQRLSAIKDHRDRTRPALQIEEILLCTRDTSAETLADYCKKANFVVHLAGVNRPQDPGEFTVGNTDFTRTLLEMLLESGNRCPVLLSSSIQASLAGRYAGSPYGQSKKAAEKLFLAYGKETSSTDSPTFTASGAAPTTIPWWQPSAIISHGRHLSPSQTRQSNWNWSTLTT